MVGNLARRHGSWCSGRGAASRVRACAHGAEADAAQGFELGQALVLGAGDGLDGVEAREQGVERLAHDGEGCKRLVGIWVGHWALTATIGPIFGRYAAFGWLRVQQVRVVLPWL